METTPVNFRFPADLLAKARKHAAKNKLSLSELVRHLLAQEVGYGGDPVRLGRPAKEDERD